MRTLIAIVVCYAILWLPLHVITILGALDKTIYDQMFVHISWMVSQWLTVTTCCVNCIVFYCKNTNYRNFVNNMLKKVICRPTLPKLQRGLSQQSRRSRLSGTYTYTAEYVTKQCEYHVDKWNTKYIFAFIGFFMKLLMIVIHIYVI